jgi:hypothetical protein
MLNSNGRTHGGLSPRACRDEGTVVCTCEREHREHPHVLTVKSDRPYIRFVLEGTSKIVHRESP